MNGFGLRDCRGLDVGSWSCGSVGSDTGLGANYCLACTALGRSHLSPFFRHLAAGANSGLGTWILELLTNPRRSTGGRSASTRASGACVEVPTLQSLLAVSRRVASIGSNRWCRSAT
jgi:hypothetical protein